MVEEEIKLYLNTTDLRNQIEIFKNEAKTMTVMINSWYQTIENTYYEQRELGKKLDKIYKRLGKVENKLND